MRKKIVSIVIILLAIQAFIANYIIAYDYVEKNPVYVKLKQADLNGIEYIKVNDTLTENTNQESKQWYCINTELPVEENKILKYNLSYDIQSEREKLLSNLQDDENANKIKSLLNIEGEQYKKLLWLFDNLHLKDYPTADLLTEEEIIAVKNLAILYFTNTDNQIKDQIDNKLKTLNDMSLDLYNYLITEAKKGESQYTEKNSYKIYTIPYSVNTNELIKKDNKYLIQTQRHNENYLIGPIEIDKNNNLESSLEIIVYDQNNKKLKPNKQYIYVDKNGNQLSNIITESDLAGIEGGFYISVSRDLVESLNIKINISYKTISKKLWLQGEENDNGIKLNMEQAIIELIQTPEEFIVELISEPKEFDLSLRKYITEVNGVKIDNERTPAIDEKTLTTLTTATYNHIKEPVIVKDKDEVTYNITIYNEGNKPGYATEIIEQLPIGLVNSTNNKTTVVSKDKNGNNKNTYAISYSTTTNQIILTMIENTESILPYKISGNLDYETIEIKCKVVQQADEIDSTVLTNVAWISKAFDAEEQKEISIDGTIDRDSELLTLPINKGNIQEYKGNSSNKEELSDSEYFYQGQQDNDDFEKIVIMPVKKEFDLSLFKYIAAVSKDSVIEDGEYLTDTGEIDGTYLRAPVITAIDSETGKITYNKNDKTALTVESGDYVLYTIRVYNEGEKNGYASKIKDTLPIGLEFVVENEQYNGIWNIENLDTDARQTIATTWYSKGQGNELNTIEGDENYKANLLKALDKQNELNIDFIDVQVLCKVVEQSSSNRILVNYAQISEQSDEFGDIIDDVDSTANEWVDEDDNQDIERIQVVTKKH